MVGPTPTRPWDLALTLTLALALALALTFTLTLALTLTLTLTLALTLTLTRTLTHTLQATISLAHAARGAAIDFDATVERLGVPAGFNLRGCVSIVYTKSLQVTNVSHPCVACGLQQSGMVQLTEVV